MIGTSLFGKSIQEHLDERVVLKYNRHLVAAEVTENNVEYFFSGNFSFCFKHALYEIGSITKLFTAHLALILEEEGKLSLEDSISKFLPKNFQTQIKIKHLLTHTSGIEDPFSVNYYNPQTGNTVLAAEYRIEEIFDYLSSQNPLPKDEIHYSNIGYALLGYILEQASGKRYFSLLKEKILNPLGMQDTFVKVPELKKPLLISGTEGGKKAPYWEVSNLPAFGGLVSSVYDLSLYLQALFFRSSPWKKIVNEKLCESIKKLPDFEVIMTYGMTIDNRFGSNFYAATGRTLGFSSFFGFDPAQKKGIILLTDASSLDPLGHHFLNNKFPLQKLYKAIDLPRDVLKEYEGIYEGNLDGELVKVSIFEADEGLNFQAENEKEILLFPKGKGRFFTRYLGEESQKVHFKQEKEKMTMILKASSNQYVFYKKGKKNGGT